MQHDLCLVITCQDPSANAHAGRSGEGAAGSQEELKLLDVTVTGTQLERVIQRGKALAADARQRYESSGQGEPAAAQPVKKRKKVWCTARGFMAGCTAAASALHQLLY